MKLPYDTTREIDYRALNREMDQCKSKIFLGDSAAFLGSLMCSLDFHWDASERCATACTDGLNLRFNPYFFQWLQPDTRCTVLLHELWHVALLHSVRRGDRDPKIWNYACDIRINNDLDNEKRSFGGLENFKPWLDHTYPKNMPEEDIYDILVKNQIKPPPSPWGNGGDGDQGDLTDEIDAAQQRDVISAVVQAVQQAKIQGEAGRLPGGIEEIVKNFLQPVIPWQSVLMKFFTDMMDTEYTWRRPNRRFDPDEMYLPSIADSDGRLEHLKYYVDVSGSVSSKDIHRCNSEVKYIHEVLKPKKLTLCLFDTMIQKEYVFMEEDAFEQIVVVGRGGTSLHCVHQDIEKSLPTAVVVFSDLDCPPMQPLPSKTPVIWIGVNCRGAKVPFGQLIHITH